MLPFARVDSHAEQAPLRAATSSLPAPYRASTPARSIEGVRASLRLQALPPPPTPLCPFLSDRFSKRRSDIDQHKDRPSSGCARQPLEERALPPSDRP